MYRENMRSMITGFGVMLFPLVIVGIAYRIWEIDFGVPPSVSGDGMLGMVLFTSIKENGIRGYFLCDRLGAPDVSALIDTPFLDMDYVLESCILAKLLPSAASMYHVFYLLTFPIASVAMYLLLRRLTDSAVLRCYMSVAYALTPYHFMRGTGHMTLSNCYVVPIALYLSSLIIEEEFQGLVPKRYLKGKWKIGIMYLSCLILGWGNIYYAFFGLICITVALFFKMIREQKISCLWHEGVIVLGVLFSVFLGLFPKILYSYRYGANVIAGVRNPMESEIFALKIIQLLLPCSYNRIGLLQKIYSGYAGRAYNINENACASLGLIATIGFIFACVWVFYRLVGGMKKVRCSVVDDNKESINITRLNYLALIILVLILYSVGGGFGTIVAYVITPELRALNRSSIYIVCLSICILVALLNQLNAVARKKVYIWGIRGIGVITAIIVLYSEIPYNETGYRNGVEQQDAILKDFFKRIEDVVDEDAMVYQLPFMHFPEAGNINNMSDYEPAYGYVYTSKIRWSYGGMRGRNTSAYDLYKNEGQGVDFVQTIREAGFEGVYIDTFGYSDGGARITAFYRDKLGISPIISADGRLYFFDLEKFDSDDWSNNAGKNFIKEYSLLLEMQLNEGDISRLAEGIVAGDEETISLLYQWAYDVGVISDDMPDTDYVTWLYATLLKRVESPEENAGWVSQISNGIYSKRDVFEAFLHSDEFRMIM